MSDDRDNRSFDDDVKKVYVTCAHCGDWPSYVHGPAAIKGIDATYLEAGERAHKNSGLHADRLKIPAKAGIKEGIVGSLTDYPSRESNFSHGKDHNA